MKILDLLQPRKKSLWLVLLPIFWAAPAGATSLAFQDFLNALGVSNPVTNPAPNDLLYLNHSNSVSTRTNSGIAWSNVVSSILNNGVASNLMLVNAVSSSTNGFNQGPGTLTGSAGNSYVQFNGTSQQFATLNIFDELLIGPEQVLVVGVTNSGGMFVSLLNPLSGSYTTQAYTNQHPSIELQDTVPRRVGGISGGTIGAASFSIGNNGGFNTGWVFADGVSSSVLNNIAGVTTPNYFCISMGQGHGSPYGFQFAIEEGSQFDALRIMANNDIGTRGAFTNRFGGNLTFKSPVNFLLPVNMGETVTFNSTNTQSTAATVTGTINGQTLTASSGIFSNNMAGWTVQTQSDGASYVITTTNTTTSANVQPYLKSSYSGDTIKLIPPQIVAKNLTPTPSLTVSSDGSVNLSANNQGATCSLNWLNGLNSAGIGLVAESGDYKFWFRGATSGSDGIVKIDTTAPFDSFRIEPDGTLTSRFGLTNKDGGTLFLLGPVQTTNLTWGASGPTTTSGTGSPNSVVTAPVGSTYYRTDGGAGTTLYVKESGTGNTGWVGK